MKWRFVRFCLFVCLFVLIQIYISEAISTELRTRLPLRLEEVVGYVWTHNIPPFLPFRSLFSRAGAAFCAEDGCRLQVLPLNRYIRDSGTRACDVTGVTFAELLHRLANPQRHVRVCVASTRVYMGTSGSFSTFFVVSAHSRVCVFVCLNPQRGYIFRTFRSSLFRHIPFSHICTLSNTHFCSCCHCHFSRHATQKKCCHWQSVFCRYKDRPLKGKCNSS